MTFRPIVINKDVSFIRLKSATKKKKTSMKNQQYKKVMGNGPRLKGGKFGIKSDSFF